MVIVDVGLLHFLPDQFAVFGDFGDPVIETFGVVQQIEDFIGGFFAFTLTEQVADLTHGVFQSIVIEDHFLVGQNFLAEFFSELQGLFILLDLLNQLDLAVHGLDGLNHPIQVAIETAHGILELVGAFLTLIGDDIVEGHFDLEPGEGAHIGVIFDACETNTGRFLRRQEDIFIEYANPVELALENLFLLLQQFDFIQKTLFHWVESAFFDQVFHPSVLDRLLAVLNHAFHQVFHLLRGVRVELLVKVSRERFEFFLGQELHAAFLLKQFCKLGIFKHQGMVHRIEIIQHDFVQDVVQVLQAKILRDGVTAELIDHHQQVGDTLIHHDVFLVEDFVREDSELFLGAFGVPVVDGGHDRTDQGHLCDNTLDGSFEESDFHSDLRAVLGIHFVEMQIVGVTDTLAQGLNLREEMELLNAAFHDGATDTEVVVRHCSGEFDIELHERAEGVLQDGKFVLVLAHHLDHGVLLTDEVVDHGTGADNGEAAVNFHDFGFALGKLDEIVDVGKLLLLEEVALLDPESDAVSILLERLVELLDLLVETE